MRFPIGTRLGAYEVLSAIAAGGMGEVYRARDTRLDRTVAIKVLPPQLATDPLFRERFDQEARTISQLTHPNICTLHDLGEHDGTAFLVMEHLEGETLAERLLEGPLPMDQAIHHAIQIAGALDAAHRHGVVHRDLKPGNVMLTRSGVKLLDFGLAKRSHAGAVTNGETAGAAPTVAAPLTAEGTILGTIQYMAPEQIEGKHIDPRTDIFAFGAVLYEMVSGRKAFTGTTPASLLAAILKEEPAPLSQLQPVTPPALEHVIRTCLAKDPDERFLAVHDVVLQLRWIAKEPMVGRPAAPSAQPRIGRERLPWLVAAIALAVPIAVGVWWLLAPRVERREVMRFTVSLPDGQRFSRVGRHVLALSPDGHRLAYVANGQLYLRSMDQLDARPVRGTNEDPMEPVFSPDGEWVAYFVPVEARGEWILKKIALAGGTPVILARLPWAPFGVSWRHRTITFGMNFDTFHGIQAVADSGGVPSTLASVDPTKEKAGHPQLLEDGKHVVFTVIPLEESVNQPQIVVQPLDGTGRRGLVNGGTDARVLPSGHLVYLHDGTIFGIRFDTKRAVAAGNPVPLIQGVTHANVSWSGQFAIAEAGTLAFQSGSGSSDRRFVWVDRQGKEERIAAPPRAYFYPRLSPDGGRIAVSSADEDHDIWVFDLTSEALTRLTFGPAADWYSVWTPNGRSVVFSSGPASSPRPDIFRAEVDRPAAPTAITRDGAGGFPYSINASGRWLVYRTGPGRPVDLMMVPVDGRGGSQPLLADPKYMEANAEISPDGRFIAYDSNESGRSEVYVRPFPEVDRTRWQISTEGGSHPFWTRSELLFRTISEPHRLMSAAIEAKAGFNQGKPRQVMDLAPYVVAGVGRQFDVSPDGKRFLMLKAADTDSPIVIVSNWFEEVRTKVGGGR